MVNPVGTSVAQRALTASARYRTLQLIKFVDFVFQLDAPSGTPAPVGKTVAHGLGKVPYITMAVNVNGEYVTIPGNYEDNNIIFSNAREVTNTNFTLYATNTAAFNYTLSIRAFIFECPLLS